MEYVLLQLNQIIQDRCDIPFNEMVAIYVMPQQSTYSVCFSIADLRSTELAAMSQILNNLLSGLLT
jgi:hypothetical protein